MIVLDTNIIIDLLGSEDHPGASWSRRTYDGLSRQDDFGCNLVVMAELAGEGTSVERLLGELDTFRIRLLDLDLDGAFAAGRAHRAYRNRGGRRDTILADFLIAGHAEALGSRFMTRDRRLASYFPDLTLITPETHP